VPNRLPGGSRPYLLILGVVLSALLAPLTARAQTAPAAPDTVAAVRVEGTTSVDPDLVRSGFGIVVGTRYSLDAVRQGIRKLYGLGFFRDVVVEGDLVPGGVALTVRVTENPRVGALEFSGNHKISESDLTKAAGTVKGQMADDRLLAQVGRTLHALYEKKGYTRAQIRPRYLPGDSESRRILLVEIDEGKKMRVEKIQFQGLHRLDPGDLRGAMKQGTKGFLKGGVYKPEVLADDMKRVEREMAKHGFRDGKVLGYDVVAGSSPDRLIVEIKVDEGPLYYNGTVAWDGNKAVSTPALYGLTKVHPGEIFNQQKVDDTVEDAVGLYAEHGYVYLQITPDYDTSDSTVNVTFQVREGKPSHVRDILISGNTRTKERVIRRQLAIRPGDLFRRSALVRSQRELQQLGYFSDIKVDSKPVDDRNSSDIDLTMDVTERQVGTASAGFGFSSAVGLTGFMELGHTNLFGNGQSLNLRMERGSKRNNVELSFTEPWFRGSPTSVGMDLFSTNRIYDAPDLNLEIRQSGGTVRLGRPLPWAYTRIYGSYGLQSEKVVDETVTPPDATSTTRVYLTGFRLDQATSVSSDVSVSLVRNSTDHPIYPTVGSNAKFRVELSGGPLGGDQDYQKYELDVARYLKTVNLGGWRPILMLRGRWGAVGEAFRKGPLRPNGYGVDTTLTGAVWDSITVGLNGRIMVPVPNYEERYPPESNELFRLGGTTYDPLRGYDDFEVVPQGNVTRRFSVVETTGADGKKSYTVSPSPAYYPGGRWMMVLTGEWQFVVAEPLHALVFGDLGGTWNEPREFRWDSLHRSLGFGLRMEVPLLGLIGFDYGYGFDRLDRATGRYDSSGWQPHIQFGRIF
jgi:outer membrane protein insertion porin family